MHYFGAIYEDEVDINAIPFSEITLEVGEISRPNFVGANIAWLRSQDNTKYCIGTAELCELFLMEEFVDQFFERFEFKSFYKEERGVLNFNFGVFVTYTYSLRDKISGGVIAAEFSKFKKE